MLLWWSDNRIIDDSENKGARMTLEGLNEIYPDTLTPIDPAAIDIYLSDMPQTKSIGTAQGVINNPDQTVREILASTAETIRTIDVSRRRLAAYASALLEVRVESPETINILPESLRRSAEELISRVKQTNE
jgi:F0F1-type ATP synthase epsilon subunit